MKTSPWGEHCGLVGEATTWDAHISHMRVPASTPAPPLLPVQLPANVPGRWQMMITYLGPCHPRARPGWGSWFLASASPRSSCCRHLGSESAEGRFFSLCPSLYLSPKSKSLEKENTPYTLMDVFPQLSCASCHWLPLSSILVSSGATPVGTAYPGRGWQEGTQDH